MARSRAIDRLLLAGGVASVGASLALRVWNRGPNIPGWDYLLASNGQFLIATHGWWEAIRETFVQTRYYWLPPAAYSAVYGLVPGALTLAVPWLYWQTATVAALWLVTLALLLAAAGWPLTSARGVGVLLLAWGAWPAGLSYGVEGYPWASCLLAYAVALLVVLHPRVRRSVFWTALGAALAYELPWHSYELAKTVGCVFVLAVLFERGVRWPVRALWALAALIQIGDAYWLHESANLVAFRRGNVGAGAGLQNSIPQLLDGAVEVGRQVFVSRTLAIPILTVAGALSLLVVREHRVFLALLWLIQLGLVVVLAASGADLLRSRRYLLVDGISMFAVVCALRTGPRYVRAVLVALLVAGNIWALADLRLFMRDRNIVRFSLPAVWSSEGVGLVNVPTVAWTDELVARVKKGERLILLHSHECVSETFTNPEATLERIYLSVGHEQFVKSVVAFQGHECRYVCLAVPPKEVAMAELERLRPGDVFDMDQRCKERMGDQITALAARFDVRRIDPGGTYGRFVLVERPP